MSKEAGARDTSSRSRMRSQRWPWLVTTAAIALSVILLYTVRTNGPQRVGDTVFLRTDRAYVVSKRNRSVAGTGLPFAKSWGAYSPSFPRAEYTVPRMCKVTMANILERHGARFPTSGATTRIKSAVAKMQAVPAWTNEEFDFIKSFVYDLGKDDLIPFGAKESFLAGTESAQRYAHLDAPFVRASGSVRVVDSATNWTAGFVSKTGVPLPDALILPEDDGFNTTLDDSMCPTAASSDAQEAIWQDAFAPRIIARLRAFADPPESLNLTNVDVPNLMSLCSFHTLASASFDIAPSTTRSPWCKLWTAEDAAQFEYWMDLDKYYGTGYGNELGPVQGIGYVNELLARLTRTPVMDSTSTNRTLDADPATFPLDRALYADFSHDNQMIPILAAMGVLNQTHPGAMNPARLDVGRTWIASQMVPFAGRVVVEKLSCGREEKEMVRLLVNEATVQLPKPCPAADDGLCGLEAFVRSQTFARGGAPEEWARCRSSTQER
ncbi:acid phosphatase [Exidia glandulosa HHB12029]|uniref:Phytase A n=1 Tax=Exidia glandulosa HHB12029 TaxID=1314781 RepID=A0A165MLY0_EXIGL|nr:acid phosphatase [Exidia glandulosa HHB12029]